MNKVMILPAPRPNEDVMAVSEARTKRAKGFRDRLCRIYIPRSSRWLKHCIDGSWDNAKYDDEPETAVAEAIEHDAGSVLYITDPDFNPEKDAAKPVVRSLLPLLVDKGMLDLLQAAPDNTTVRAILSAKFGLMIPNDVVGYEAVKRWVESNHPSDEYIRLQARKSLILPVRREWNEYGTARYNRRAVAVASLNLDPMQVLRPLLPSLLSGETSLDGFIKLVERGIDKKIESGPMSYGTPGLSSFQPDGDRELYENGLDTTAVRNWITNFLRSEIPPAKWGEFGL